MDAFEGLTAYLEGLGARSCTLPFSAVEELTGRRLPPGAAEASWWRRCGSGDAPGWVRAGWRVEGVWADGRQVRFVRTGDAAVAGRSGSATTSDPTT